jgi:signal transduction histidine kinase
VHCACGSIRVQSEMFSKALFNLLDNAIEATSSGHPVFIDASHTADGDLLWQIQDTGRGMDLDMLARLGEPHAGLGVALANAIIQQHGGMLRFESAPGVGTTASVWLPADVGDMQPGSLASGLPEWVM